MTWKLQSFDESHPSKEITTCRDPPWPHVIRYILPWKPSGGASVFRGCSAGGCEVTTGREGMASRWWGCWALPAKHQACDRQASCGWSIYSWSSSRWTSLHGTSPGKNKICSGDGHKVKKFDTFLSHCSFDSMSFDLIWKSEITAATKTCEQLNWLVDSHVAQFNSTTWALIWLKTKTEEFRSRRKKDPTFDYIDLDNWRELLLLRHLMKWGVWPLTFGTVHPQWYTKCVQEGREESLWWCEQVNRLTPDFDRLMSGEWWVTPPPAAAGWEPPPSFVPSLWGSRLDLLQTVHTKAPAGGCGTTTPHT